MSWRHLISEVHDGAMNMSEDDALRVGRDQARMLSESSAQIRSAIHDRENPQQKFLSAPTESGYPRDSGRTLLTETDNEVLEFLEKNYTSIEKAWVFNHPYGLVTVVREVHAYAVVLQSDHHSCTVFGPLVKVPELLELCKVRMDAEKYD